MAEVQGVVARVTTALRYAFTGAMPMGWFGPGQPIAAQAPEDVRGRARDFPFAGNLNYQPRATEPINFATLKKLADESVLIRMAIERHKDLVKAQDWVIKARLKGKASDNDGQISAITEFLNMPDGQTDWAQWLNAALEQALVIDALTIYGRPTLGGDLFALELIDGATITPVVGYDGRRPRAPDAAYQQVLKGLNAVHYTSDELIYSPMNFRVDKLYGYSKVEQVVVIAKQSIARMVSQLGYFEVGNIGDGFFTAPEGYTPEQVRAIETHFNDLMASNAYARRRLPFVPSGTKWEDTKGQVLQDAFDEWLARIVCFVFGLSPTSLMKQQGLGQGSAKIDQEAAEEAGIAPVMLYVERVMSRCIAQFFKRPDLEFAFVRDSEVDSKTKSEMDERDWKSGKKTINQLRDEIGAEAVPGGDVPVVVLGNTIVPVASFEFLPVEPQPQPKALADVNDTGDADGDAVAASDDDPADDEGKADPLAKAADATRLERVVARLLTQRANAAADTIPDAIGLVKSMDDYAGRIEAALDSVDWSWSGFAEAVEPFLVGVATAAGTDAVSEFDLFDRRTLANISKRAIEYAQARAAKLVGMKRVAGVLVDNPNATWSIAKTTRDMLRGLIADAMEQGSSNDELATAIREAAAFDKARAETIARTETAYADIRGNAIGWLETGVVSGAQFSAAPDCCPTCQKLDGDIRPLTEPEDLDLPHPSCRCDWVAVLTSDMPV
jgi:SPP1 gp7 family putative phage head morphogenesis protein